VGPGKPRQAPKTQDQRGAPACGGWSRGGALLSDGFLVEHTRRVGGDGMVGYAAIDPAAR